MVNKSLTLIAGLGVGAVLMYAFDPVQGRRRRERVRDKAVDAMERTGREVRSRSRQLVRHAQVFSDGYRTAQSLLGWTKRRLA